MSSTWVKHCSTCTCCRQVSPKSGKNQVESRSFVTYKSIMRQRKYTDGKKPRWDVERLLEKKQRQMKSKSYKADIWDDLEEL